MNKYAKLSIYKQSLEKLNLPFKEYEKLVIKKAKELKI